MASAAQLCDAPKRGRNVSEHSISSARRERIPLRDERKPLVPFARNSLVLLVEDDRDMRELLATALRRSGLRVVEAADGDEALTWLGPGVLEGDLRRIPAVVVSDIRLPDFSGLEILEGLQLARHSVPVILITAFGDVETHALARRLGARRVIDKPFDTRVLVAAVKSLMYLGRDGDNPRGPEGSHVA
jgi:two-component system response regulator (stage 0 sporulation protein F)